VADKSIKQRGMEEAPENGMESSHSAHGNRIGIEFVLIVYLSLCMRICCGQIFPLIFILLLILHPVPSDLSEETFLPSKLWSYLFSLVFIIQLRTKKSAVITTSCKFISVCVWHLCGTFFFFMACQPS
jgi:hypothetical protein